MGEGHHLLKGRGSWLVVINQLITLYFLTWPMQRQLLQGPQRDSFHCLHSVKRCYKT